MKKLLYVFLLFFLAVSTVGCENQENVITNDTVEDQIEVIEDSDEIEVEDPTQDTKIERIIEEGGFGWKFEYLTQNGIEKIESIRSNNLIENTNTFSESNVGFKYEYENDTVNILNLNRGEPDGINSIKYFYRNDTLVEVRRQFGSAANIWRIEYFVDQMKIYMERFQDNQTRDLGYIDYFLDEKNNVSKEEIYAYGGPTGQELNLVLRRTYNYDDYPNPWKGILFKIMFEQSLRVKYFNNNNIISVETFNPNGSVTTTTETYDFIYHENLPIKYSPNFFGGPTYLFSYVGIKIWPWD